MTKLQLEKELLRDFAELYLLDDQGDYKKDQATKLNLLERALQDRASGLLVREGGRVVFKSVGNLETAMDILNAAKRGEVELA